MNYVQSTFATQINVYMHAVSFHTFIEIQHKGTAPTQFGAPDNIEARETPARMPKRPRACVRAAGREVSQHEMEQPVTRPSLFYQARLKETFPGGYTTDKEEFKKWLKELGPSPSAPGSIKAVRWKTSDVLRSLSPHAHNPSRRVSL